jgi:hypothetical protein
MGRIKLGIGGAGAVIVLVGVLAVLSMQGGGNDPARPVVSRAAGDSSAPDVTAVAPVSPGTEPAQSPPPPTKPAGTTATGAKASEASSAPGAVPGQPTAADIQRVIAGITADVLSPPNSVSTTPLTKEQVEAQVREQLKKLGITY